METFSTTFDVSAIAPSICLGMAIGLFLVRLTIWHARRAQRRRRTLYGDYFAAR